MRDAQVIAQAAIVTAQQYSEENAKRLRRQPERFKIGDKVQLNLKQVRTQQISKELSLQHAKYEMTAVLDALNVEINVPGNIQKRFHIELVKRTGKDLFSSQRYDDTRNAQVVDKLNIMNINSNPS